jgi:septal ring-binding cell division protein DamX
MTNSLDISLHGAQRVEVIERLVHICRYSPGLVYLDGEPGTSPVKFLRHMADLLRDELDFSLLDAECAALPAVCDELIGQWFVYRSEGDGQTDAQCIHHFLDVGAQGGRMALVVVERTSLLDDAALNFLIGLLARHSQLTILFSGVVDTRPLLRRASQAEVPVHRIQLPESMPLESMPPESIPPQNMSSTRSVDSFADTQQSSRTGFSVPLSAGRPEALPLRARNADRMPGGDMDVSWGGVSDDLFAADRSSDAGLAASRRHSERPSMERTQRIDRASRVEPALGVSTRLSALQAWGSETYADMRRKKSGLPLLVVSVASLGALLILVALYYPQQAARVDSVPLAVMDGATTAQSVVSVVTPAAPPVVSPSAAPAPVVGNVINIDSSNSGATDALADAPVPVGAVVAAPPAPVVQTPPVLAPQALAAIVPVVKSSPATTKSKPAVSKDAEPMAEKAWRAAPNRFTVQLAAAYGESAIKGLAAKLPKTHPHLIYRTQREGKPWFVLIYGSFATREAATTAKAQLAASLKGESSPWVRSQGDVFVR